MLNCFDDYILLNAIKNCNFSNIVPKGKKKQILDISSFLVSIPLYDKSKTNSPFSW